MPEPASVSPYAVGGMVACVLLVAAIGAMGVDLMRRGRLAVRPWGVVFAGILVVVTASSAIATLCLLAIGEIAGYAPLVAMAGADPLGVSAVALAGASAVAGCAAWGARPRMHP